MHTHRSTPRDPQNLSTRSSCPVILQQPPRAELDLKPMPRIVRPTGSLLSDIVRYSWSGIVSLGITYSLIENHSVTLEHRQ